MLWYVFGIVGLSMGILLGNKRTRKWCIRKGKKYGSKAVRGTGKWVGTVWKNHKKNQARRRKKKQEMTENREAWKGERKVRKGSGRGKAHLCGHPTRAGQPCTVVTYYPDCGRH